MKSTTYLFLAVLLICAGCPESFDEPDSRIIIVNNSGNDIVFFDQFNLSTDTLLSTFPFPLLPENSDDRTITSNSSDTVPGSYKRIFNDHPSNVLMLYLFSRDTIEQVSWERIVDEYLVLRRYDLTLEDLEAMDWTVEYP